MMELIEFIRMRKSILMHCFFIVLFSCVSPFTELEIMIFRYPKSETEELHLIFKNLF